jgi:hypothetical protein
MSSVSSSAVALLNVFASLPLLTQWGVAILLSSGLVVHLFVYNERTAHDAPSIFTTSGIFFTFVGIAQGLLNFNPHDLEGSVPQLLEGLQTAFIASVVGVFIALTIKLRLALFGLPRRSDAITEEGATVDDLYNQMVAVQQSLVGEDDSTLLSQIKLSRQDTNDRLDKLQRSQSEFMEKMAENNSKALIKALEEVIRDFNVKISEQFGENFKKLNEAVGGLLEWQESYRIQMSEMIEQQTRTSQNMQVATERYTDVVAKAESFNEISKNLATVLAALVTQRGQIEQSLKSLGELLLKASGSLPEIQNKIMDLTQQMTFGTKQNQDEITKTIRNGSDALQSAVADVKKLMLEATQLTNQEVNAHVKQLADKTNIEIAKLDQALERELTNALTTLGRQLTALSQRFVEDYMPLTQKLHDLIGLAGKA